MPTLSLGKVRPVYKGAYAAATAYTVLDRVSFNGTVYECVQDAAAGVAPSAEGDSAFWVILGAQGAKGDKGDKGDPGPQGPAGANGADGPQGIQGPKGEKGEKGDKGDTGMAGPQGIPGEKGADGTQGPQGPQGPAGPQGPKGDTPPLSDAVNSTAQDVAASCKAVKTAYDKAVEAGRIPTATATVLGLVKTGTNIVNSSGLISVNNASTTARGVVQLSSAVNSASETLAATAKAVKTVYDKAVSAESAAAAARGFNTRVLITASGSWSAPTSGWYHITLIGGGGGGGGSAPNINAGGGGSSGERKSIYSYLEKNQSLSMVIGAGGSAGVSGGNYTRGGSGGATSVTINGVAHTALGGTGGYHVYGGAPVGALDSVGYPGAAGGLGRQNYEVGAIGGAGGGPGGGVPVQTNINLDAQGCMGGGGAGVTETTRPVYTATAGKGAQGCVILEFYNPDTAR